MSVGVLCRTLCDVPPAPPHERMLRDAAFFLIGSACTLVLCAWLFHPRFPPPHGLRRNHLVTSVRALRETIPPGWVGSCPEDSPKVLDHLDAQMLQFLELSPFVALATADKRGRPYVSPKGDLAGFVEVLKRDGRGVALRIPDRSGNKLVFGHQNIIDGSGQVGLMCFIPGNNTLLRCGGHAWISRDPELLEKHAARGQPAKLVVHVVVEYAFFHCAKANIRSGLWDPKTWLTEHDQIRVRWQPYWPARKQLDEAIDKHYSEVGESVAGQRAGKLTMREDGSVVECQS
jgi:predicted pyridoxine 5'-phosphate oxidase superfamily flavin-nucleotide-binding protein